MAPSSALIPLAPRHTVGPARRGASPTVWRAAGGLRRLAAGDLRGSLRPHLAAGAAALAAALALAAADAVLLRPDMVARMRILPARPDAAASLRDDAARLGSREARLAAIGSAGPALIYPDLFGPGTAIPKPDAEAEALRRMDRDVQVAPAGEDGLAITVRHRDGDAAVVLLRALVSPLAALPGPAQAADPAASGEALSRGRAAPSPGAETPATAAPGDAAPRTISASGPGAGSAAAALPEPSGAASAAPTAILAATPAGATRPPSPSPAEAAAATRRATMEADRTALQRDIAATERRAADASAALTGVVRDYAAGLRAADAAPGKGRQALEQARTALAEAELRQVQASVRYQPGAAILGAEADEVAKLRDLVAREEKRVGARAAPDPASEALNAERRRLGKELTAYAAQRQGLMGRLSAVEAALAALPPPASRPDAEIVGGETSAATEAAPRSGEAPPSTESAATVPGPSHIVPDGIEVGPGADPRLWSVPAILAAGLATAMALPLLLLRLRRTLLTPGEVEAVLGLPVLAPAAVLAPAPCLAPTPVLAPASVPAGRHRSDAGTFASPTWPEPSAPLAAEIDEAAWPGAADALPAAAEPPARRLFRAGIVRAALGGPAVPSAAEPEFQTASGAGASH